MKLFLLLLSAYVATCGERQTNDQALGKFATSEELSGETDRDYFYARYRFSHEEYEAVEVAVQVAMHNGHPAKLRVKDLSSTAQDNAIEEATLSSHGCSLSFTGMSSVAEGGTYTGTLGQSGGVVDDCCGTMTFVPTIDTTLTFTGKKLATLSAADWKRLTGEASDPNTKEPDNNDGNTDTDDGDNTSDDTDTDDNTDTDDASEQIFYALDSSTILLSRTSFLPPRARQSNRYLMQAVIGTNSDGTYKPPVVHIKRVNRNGTIASECLSLLFDEQDNTAGGSSAGRFKFNFNLSAANVDNVWGFSDMYGNDPYSDEDFFTIGVQFPDNPDSTISYSALRAGAGTNGSVPLVPPKLLATQNKKWGIVDDIVAAFGEDSSCDAQGHNRVCAGCIMQ